MKKLKVPFVEPQKEIGELARKAVSCVSKGKATLKEIQAAIVKMVEQSASA
jgi:hypothetical protein